MLWLIIWLVKSLYYDYTLSKGGVNCNGWAFQRSSYDGKKNNRNCFRGC